MQHNINFDLYNQARSDQFNVLLVPNQRLVRHLLSQACRSQINKHNKVIASFNIYSLNDFVNHIYNTLLECGVAAGSLSNDKYILNGLQREILFKNIITDYINQQHQFSNNITANSIYSKVIQAWSISKQWDLNWTDFKNFYQPEAHLFHEWASLYQDILAERGYVDPDDKINDLISIIDHQVVKLFKLNTIHLYGFDDISPVYQQLFDKLKKGGLKELAIIEEISNPDLSPDRSLSKIKLFTAQSLNQEIDSIAAWAVDNHSKQAGNIGIIVPNLGHHRALFTKAFSEKFIDRDAWNISGGEPLSHVPVIKAAIILLEIVVYKKNNLNQLIYLLQSNYYLKNADDQQWLSLVNNIIMEIKHHGYKELTSSEIIYYITKINQPLANAITNASLQNTDSKLPSQWIIAISQILITLGWPANAGTTINSFEYQAIMQWQSCLQELALLDKIYGSMTLSKLFAELKSLADNRPFQIETNKNTIDVLGMLEGAGLKYDKLWIANLTSEIWPSAPDTNPFIPIEIQKKYNLPHSTAEREVAYAKKLTSRYLNSSSDITISYSKFDGEKENRLSLLIDSNLIEKISLTNQAKNAEDTASNHFIRAKDNKFIKYFTDDSGPQIIHTHIKAGIQALSLQNICPFKAFAQIRLGALSNCNLDIGPASWLRGQVVHDVLHVFYTEYNTKNKLADLITDTIDYPDSRVDSILDKVIKDVLRKYKTKYHNIYKLGIMAVELEIIKKLIKQLLELEINRADFTIVALEQSCLVKLNGLQFNVRVDRVDITNNEQLLIIDYKTSPQNINGLLKDSLTDPQLPLYLFLDQFNNCTAVIYTEILYHQAGYNGIGVEKFVDGCSKVDNWEDLKTQWYDLLNQTAQDFASGNAKVDPINGEATCRTCHLSSFCRKDELCLMS